MEISSDIGLGRLQIDSQVIEVPHQIGYIVEIGGLAVVLLESNVDYENENPDFRLDEPGRNIVAFDSLADLVWMVSEAPQPSDSDETSYYDYLFTLSDNLFARDVTNRIYELNVRSGEIEQIHDCRTLPLGGEEIPLDGWLVKVVEFGEYVIIGVGERDYHTLYGFDIDGTELWRGNERRGTAYWDGEVLIEKVTLGPRTETFSRLDPDSGERLAEIEVENTESGWEYVGDINEDG